VITRSIQVASIYGVAAAGAAQKAGKAAMNKQMDKVKKTAKKAANGAVKEAKEEVKKADEKAEGKGEEEEAERRLLEQVDDVVHVAAGAGLLGAGSFFGAGALGARMLSALEGAADPRFLTEAAGKAAEEATKKKGFIAGLWGFLFPTGGLSQSAVLMIAQLLNFFVASKGVYDDCDSQFDSKFWQAWLSGECLIYFGEILLLVVFMLATPEFPYSIKALWKEDISAITLIILSAMTIIILNSLWGYKMVKLAISKIKDIHETIIVYKEKAISTYEYAMSVYEVCKERAKIMMGDDAKKKRELKEEIYAGFKQQMFETCPWLETAQRLREQYLPQFFQDPEEGGYCGDLQIALCLVALVGLGYGIFCILHYHAVKAIHHGIHHIAKHADHYTGEDSNSTKKLLLL
jgi:hypothetical protein